MRTTTIALLIAMPASPLHAQLVDPTLPSAEPEALQHLSDNRVRQRAHAGEPNTLQRSVRMLLPNEGLKQASCKGRHEVIKTQPAPICCIPAKLPAI